MDSTVQPSTGCPFARHWILRPNINHPHRDLPLSPPRSAVRGAAQPARPATLARMVGPPCHMLQFPASLFENIALYEPVVNHYGDGLLRQISNDYANNPPSRGHVLPNNLAAIIERLLEGNLIGLAAHNSAWFFALDRIKRLGPSEADPITQSGQRVQLLNEGGELADAHLGGRVVDLEGT